MLNNLVIDNIALISHLDIAFDNGLNVLTGETGAGKSIIVDSLAFALGERADKTLIKHGEQVATVEAVFVVGEDDKVLDVLQQLGFERDTTIVISRTMNISGRNECRLNGKLCSNSMLRQITINLVDIFGQSQHLSLFKSDTHIDIIDNFSCDTESIQQLKLFIKQIRDVDNQLKTFGGTDAERERSLDMLKYQIDEINKAKLTIEEEQQLQAQRVKVMNIEKIVTALNTALSSLNQGEKSAFNNIAASFNAINGVASLDEQLHKLSLRLSDCKYEVLDIYETLEQFRNSCDYDTREIDRMQERLDIIKSISRKYGGSVEKALDFVSTAQQEFLRLSNATEIIGKLNAERQILLSKAFQCAVKISIFRKASALRFATLVKEQLIDLGMKDATFVVDFNTLESAEQFNNSLSYKGIDTVEFLLSANKGEPVKPLVKVISGGEMSRFMLAVKNITAVIEKIPTMVFDEIDTGISGKMAQMVAIKLAQVSRVFQCIAITHLPQIASIGDTNFCIIKSVVNERTVSDISKLSTEGKIVEIARLSGGEISNAAIEHAKELVAWADNKKANI